MVSSVPTKNSKDRIKARKNRVSYNAILDKIINLWVDILIKMSMLFCTLVPWLSQVPVNNLCIDQF